MSEVVMYGTTTCSKCKILIMACEKKNYKVKYVTVDAGDAMFHTLLEHSVKSFPVLEVDGNFIFSKSLSEFEEIIAANQH